MGPPFFFAKKKNGRLGLCVNYCALNKNTISDSYFLLHIEELFSRLKSTQYFSRLDFRDGYFYILIAKEDVYKRFFHVAIVHLSTLLCHLGL